MHTERFPRSQLDLVSFELTCSYDVRGPLYILKEAWLPEGGKQNYIAAYVMDIRTKMKEMSDLVKKNLEKAQQKHKEWIRISRRKVSIATTTR